MIPFADASAASTTSFLALLAVVTIMVDLATSWRWTPVKFQTSLKFPRPFPLDRWRGHHLLAPSPAASTFSLSPSSLPRCVLRPCSYTARTSLPLHVFVFRRCHHGRRPRPTSGRFLCDEKCVPHRSWRTSSLGRTTGHRQDLSGPELLQHLIVEDSMAESKIWWPTGKSCDRVVDLAETVEACEGAQKCPRSWPQIGRRGLPRRPPSTKGGS